MEERASTKDGDWPIRRAQSVGVNTHGSARNLARCTLHRGGIGAIEELVIEKKRRRNGSEAGGQIDVGANLLSATQFVT